MKTGLTQKQKVTEFYFNEHDDLTHYLKSIVWQCQEYVCRLLCEQPT